MGSVEQADAADERGPARWIGARSCSALLDRHEGPVRGELEVVTEWLVTASAEVAPEYVQLPVASSEEPEYRERVYCYELYHRWRCHWPAGFPFSLSGEVNKQGHPLIRGEEKPDFLVHVPGQMRNLLVVEVKPQNAPPARMADDLKKLTRFRRDLYDQDGVPASYHAAYFWLYGLPLDDWPALRGRLRNAVVGSADFDPGLVSCFVHEKAGTRAVPVSWE